jgi:hypothetical protein
LCAKPFALDPYTPKRIAFAQKMRQSNGTYCSLPQADSMTAPGPKPTDLRLGNLSAFDPNQTSQLSRMATAIALRKLGQNEEALLSLD